MIFQHTHAWIFDVSPATGQPKTQTRRLVKPGQKLVQHVAEDGFDLPVVISAGGKRLHYMGQRVAAQPGRNIKGDGKIYINDIQQQDVRNITNNDARAEGFYHALDFLITWVGMHDVGLWMPQRTPTQISEISLKFQAERMGQSQLSLAYWVDDIVMKRPNSHYQAFAYRFEALEEGD